jgi:hypothetical protein
MRKKFHDLQSIRFYWSRLNFAADNLAATAAQKEELLRALLLALLGLIYTKINLDQRLLWSFICGISLPLADYNSIFENEGENGAESVFEVQYTDVEGGFDAQCSEGNVAVGFSGPRNYSEIFYLWF